MSGRLRRLGVILLNAGAVGAVAALVFRDQVVRRRRDLFSANAFRRLAALRHLTSQPASVDAVNLLRDFAAWEPRPVLRNQAAGILERMEADLLRQAEGG